MRLCSMDVRFTVKPTFAVTPHWLKLLRTRVVQVVSDATTLQEN